MKIEIRQCDDWIAVYKDGKMVWNTHSCSITDGLEALGIDFASTYYEHGDYDEVTITLSDGADLFPEKLPWREQLEEQVAEVTGDTYEDAIRQACEECDLCCAGGTDCECKWHEGVEDCPCSCCLFEKFLLYQ